VKTAPIQLRRRVPATVHELGGEMPELLRRVFLARNVTRASELDYRLQRLPAPDRLKGMGEALELLAGMLTGDRHILVIGDFDADGATSTAVMLRGLRALGATHVDYLVPDRFRFGYGLTSEIVAVALQREPDLIITVDNGISSLEGVATAVANGVRVLITDHHLAGDRLPAADAILNPNQPGDEFPSRNIAGVGVAFYLLSGLRTRLREDGWFSRRGISEPNLADLLDLVALGTVADVVPLDHVNRTLVRQGLARINAGRCCAGISALIEVAGRRQGRLTTSDLGFAVAPRLNAAGRLEDMSLGIECLLTDDPGRARELAVRLDELNRERRGIEEEMRQDAVAAIRDLHLESAGLPTGLCLFDPGWHQGVIGILASRIKERLHRPVIAFAPADDGGAELKGSARSISGLHIRDTLDAVAAHHPGLISRFGGHAMAAGLSLPAAHYDAFASAFDAEVSARLDAEALDRVLLTDGELAPPELTLETAQMLRDAGPWGQQFPEPLFEGRFRVVERRIVGGSHLKLVLKAGSGPTELDAIAFGIAEGEADLARGSIHAAYRLDVNEFRGRRSVQLIIEHFRPC